MHLLQIEEDNGKHSKVCPVSGHTSVLKKIAFGFLATFAVTPQSCSSTNTSLASKRFLWFKVGY